MIEANAVYRHLAAGSGYWGEKIKWCQENLYHGGHYEPNWCSQYPYIFFYDEQEYAWFVLRWS